MSPRKSSPNKRRRNIRWVLLAGLVPLGVVLDYYIRDGRIDPLRGSATGIGLVVIFYPFIRRMGESEESLEAESDEANNGSGLWNTKVGPLKGLARLLVAVVFLSIIGLVFAMYLALLPVEARSLTPDQLTWLAVASGTLLLVSFATLVVDGRAMRRRGTPRKRSANGS